MLEEAGREKGEAEVKLSGAEGRMNGLEHQLTRTEGQRKELQLRLANLVSVLQATLGLHDLTQPSLLQVDLDESSPLGTPSRSSSPNRRSPSPRPYRSLSPSRLLLGMAGRGIENVLLDLFENLDIRFAIITRNIYTYNGIFKHNFNFANSP